MDSLFNDVDFTSRSSRMSEHEDSQMGSEYHITPESQEESQNVTEDTDSSRCLSMSMMTDLNEHTSSNIDDISRRIQELVEKINDRRTNDHKMLDSLQQNLEDKVTEMKENIYKIYEVNNNEMQVKLQELSEVLERCTKLNTELAVATQALASLSGRLALSQTSGP